jgi:hypothetical protein
MAIPPTDIRILFTNYDIIAYLLNLASCSEHFISIKHRILAYLIKKKSILTACMSLNNRNVTWFKIEIAPLFFQVYVPFLK